jgi:hypothetical protein
MSTVSVSNLSPMPESNGVITVDAGTNVIAPGTIVQVSHMRTDLPQQYLSSTTGNGNPIWNLQLSIAPKYASSLLVMEWNINFELHHDNGFVIHQDGNLIQTLGYQGYNNNAGNQRWSGYIPSKYDNNQDSTPQTSYILYSIPAFNTARRSYMPAVRGSGATAYNMTLNRTLSSLGQNAYEVYTSTGTIWEIAAQTDRDYGPPIQGYVGWYIADSWDGERTWRDISGNNNHATVSSIGIERSTSVATQKNVGIYFRTLRGNTTGTVLWPEGILPSTYTLFHVARYNDTKQRIFTGFNNDWLSGFSQGRSGQAFHGGWLTNNSTDYYGDNWVLSTDQNSRYRGFSGGSSNESTGGGGTSARLAINTSASVSGQQSDWEVSEVLVYPRTLSESEYITVENWFKAKYGMI